MRGAKKSPVFLAVAAGAIGVISAVMALQLSSALMGGNRWGWCGALEPLNTVGLGCTTDLAAAQTRVMIAATLAAVLIIGGVTLGLYYWRRYQWWRMRQGRPPAGPQLPAFATAVRVYALMWWFMIGELMGQPAPLIFGQVPSIGIKGDTGPWEFVAALFLIPAIAARKVHLLRARPITMPEKAMDDIDAVLAKGGGWCTIAGVAGAGPAGTVVHPLIGGQCLAWRLGVSPETRRTWSEEVYEVTGNMMTTDRYEPDGTRVVLRHEVTQIAFNMWRIDHTERVFQAEQVTKSTAPLLVQIKNHLVKVDPADVDLALPQVWAGDTESPGSGGLVNFFKTVGDDYDYLGGELTSLQPGARVSLTGALHRVDGELVLLSPRRARSLGVGRYPEGDRSVLRTQ